MSARPRLPVRRIRWLWPSLALALLAAILCAPMGWSWYCRTRAAQAIRIRHYRAAGEWLDSARFLRRNDPDVEFLQARLDRRRGRLDDMARQLEKCARLGVPRSTVERELWMAHAQAGDLRELEAHLSELLTDDAAELQEVCDAYVNGCILNYRLPEAIHVLELWIADFPQDPEPPYLRGRLLEHASRLEEAEKSYRQALSLEPAHAPAAYNLARLLLFEQEQPEAALNAYRQAAGHLEQPQPALVGEALCLTRLNRLDEARSVLNQALQLSNGVEEAYRVVGDPGDTAAAQAFAAYGRLEIAAGNTEEAAAWFGQAIEANPRDWKTRYLLGTALQELGRSEAAAGHLKLVDESSAAMVELDALLTRVPHEPDNADLRCRLGELLLKYVSEQQGLVWLDSALQIDPSHAGAHAALADYYTRQARIDPRFAELAARHRRFAPAEQPAQ